MSTCAASFPTTSRAPELDAALTTVTNVVESSEEDRHATLLARYGTVRRFLPLLLKAVAFGSTEAGKPVLDALGFLRRQAPAPRGTTLPPRSSPARGCILQQEQARVDHRAYTLCAAERLREALRRRDMFFSGSRRWADPCRQLLSGAEWEAARDEVRRSLAGRPMPASSSVRWPPMAWPADGPIGSVVGRGAGSSNPDGDDGSHPLLTGEHRSRGPNELRLSRVGCSVGHFELLLRTPHWSAKATGGRVGLLGEAKAAPG